MKAFKMMMRQVFWFCLTTLILPRITFAAETTTAAPSYEVCMSMIEENPAQAREYAARWQTAGGGFQAAHCGAIAMASLGAKKEAATNLIELATAPSSLSPHDRVSLLRLAGEFWLDLVQPQLAKQSLDRALLLDPTDVASLEARSRAEASLENWTGAIQNLNQALILIPNDPTFLTLRAAALRKMGEPQKALIDARAATQIDPDGPLGWFERGAAAQIVGDQKEAKQSWLKTIALDPEGEAGNLAKVNLQKISYR